MIFTLREIAMNTATKLLESHSIIIEATKDAVRQKLMDVASWPTWDTGMESTSFDKPLVAGSKGQIKLKNGPTVELRITEMQIGRFYTSEFDMLGTTFVFEHVLEPVDALRIKLTFNIKAHGLTSAVTGAMAQNSMQLSIWMSNFAKTLDHPDSNRYGGLC